MKLYAIRNSKTKTLIGVVYAAKLAHLASLIDPETNPAHCEYRPLPSPGGALWYRGCDLEKDRDEDDEDMGFFPDEAFDELLKHATAAKHGWEPVCPGEVPNYDDELVAAE